MNPYLTELRDKDGVAYSERGLTAEVLEYAENNKHKAKTEYTLSVIRKIELVAYKAGFDKAHDTLMPILASAKEALVLLCADWDKFHADASTEALALPDIVYRKRLHEEAKKALHNIEKVLK